MIWPSVDQSTLPDHLDGFGVTLRDGNVMRVMRDEGKWRVAAKLKRFNRDSHLWETKWFVESDTLLEWAIAKLHNRSAPSEPDRLLAIYVMETKIPI